MNELSKEEIEAFIGLNESYTQMEKENNAIAPRCHFRPMFLDNGDGDNYSNKWWECSVCGHTKSVV